MKRFLPCCAGTVQWDKAQTEEVFSAMPHKVLVMFEEGLYIRLLKLSYEESFGL